MPFDIVVTQSLFLQVVIAIISAGMFIVAFLIIPLPKLRRHWAIYKVNRDLVSTKKKEDAQKKLDEIKKQSQPVVVETPALPIEGKPAGIKSLEEIQIGTWIGIELTKPKGDGRITIVKGRVRVKANWLGRLPNLFFFVWQKRAFFIKVNGIIEVYQKPKFKRSKESKPILKLVYDILYSEHLAQDGSITWDDELESIKVDSVMDQYIVVATFETGFSFTPALKTALIIIGVMGTLLGLGLNGALQLTPTVIVHWLPR